MYSGDVSMYWKYFQQVNTHISWSFYWMSLEIIIVDYFNKNVLLLPHFVLQPLI